MDGNYVGMLLEYASKNKSTPPVFTPSRTGGPDHSPLFMCKVEAEGLILFSSTSSGNINEAKRNVAKEMCEKLGIIPVAKPMTFSPSYQSPQLHHDSWILTGRGGYENITTTKMNATSSVPLPSLPSSASPSVPSLPSSALPSYNYSGYSGSNAVVRQRHVIFWDMDYQSHLTVAPYVNIEDYSIHGITSQPQCHDNVPENVTIHIAENSNNITLNNSLHIAMIAGQMATQLTGKRIKLIMEEYYRDLIVSLLRTIPSLQDHRTVIE